VPGVADLVDVLGPKADLGTGQAAPGRVGLTEQIRDERLHARSGEQGGRVLAWYQVGPGYGRMPALAVELQVRTADAGSLHGWHCPFTSVLDHPLVWSRLSGSRCGKQPD
jgi:hypothetical protein